MAENTELTADLRRLETTVRGIKAGQLDSVGEFTVATGATGTTVRRLNVTERSTVLLMPLDATTALEYGLGTTFVTPGDRQFVVTHPNNGNARRYRFVIFA